MEEAVKIVNLTPHEVTIGGHEPIPPSGMTARVSQATVMAGQIDGMRVVKTVLGEVCGLPAERNGVVLIVSQLVARQVPDRSDVFYPAEPVRDGAGNIMYCKALGRAL